MNAGMFDGVRENGWIVLRIKKGTDFVKFLDDIVGDVEGM